MMKCQLFLQCLILQKIIWETIFRTTSRNIIAGRNIPFTLKG
jgi:hypothetical protein